MINIPSKHQIYIRLPDVISNNVKNDPNVVGFNFQKLSDSSVITAIKETIKQYNSTTNGVDFLKNLSQKDAIIWCKEKLTKETKTNCIQILQPLMPLSYENHSGITLIDLHENNPKYCIFIPKNLSNGFKSINIEEKNIMRLLTASDYLSLFYPKLLEGLIWNAQIEKYVPAILNENVKKVADSLDIKDEKTKISQEVLQNIEDINFLNETKFMTCDDVRCMFTEFYGALKQGA